MINGDPGVYAFFVVRQGFKQFISHVCIPRKKKANKVCFADLLKLEASYMDGNSGIIMDIDGTQAEAGHARTAVIEMIELNKKDYPTQESRFEALRANSDKWREIWGAGKGTLIG